MLIALVESKPEITNQDPFTAVFKIILNDATIRAALIGKLGKAIFNNVLPGDTIRIEGYFLTPYSFIITEAIMSFDAAIGRNLNTYV
jgi:hypothetical protein